MMAQHTRSTEVAPYLKRRVFILALGIGLFAAVFAYGAFKIVFVINKQGRLYEWVGTLCRCDLTDHALTDDILFYWPAAVFALTFFLVRGYYFFKLRRRYRKCAGRRQQQAQPS